MMRLTVVALLTVLASAGCGDRSPLHDDPCDDDADCATEVVVNGDHYLVSCRAVAPELVTDRVVARGRALQGQREVRTIVGIDQSRRLAISLPGGHCSDGDPVALSDWTLLIGRGKPEFPGCRVTLPEADDRATCRARGR